MRGRRRKGRGTLCMRIASFTDNSERQSFVRRTIAIFSIPDITQTLEQRAGYPKKFIKAASYLPMLMANNIRSLRTEPLTGAPHPAPAHPVRTT
ncbi:hypothetical protein EVAR_79203_1 [Eumeta japonica]|uniref:Uncharacterized protein n=1 Tax=Eumeta variegata TaxID=151549 RepID=A0A4C1UV32_EUMVA|nr:hypothetical protein EVAR_79203_1 [Eumeta japonica]